MGVLVAAATLWVLASMALILPLFHVPDLLRVTAASLLAAEFIAVVAWSYASESCSPSACAGTAVLHAAAFQDIPILSFVFLVATLFHATRSR